MTVKPEAREEIDRPEYPTQGDFDPNPSTVHDYDRDLLDSLPPITRVDELIEYYFENCNWIYRTVDPTAFMERWELFKSGRSADRIVLATVCMIMGITVLHLPINHRLLEHLEGTSEEIAHEYDGVMRTLLQRNMAEPVTYTLDLAEFFSIRCHFQSLCKTDTEQIWSVKDQLMSMCVAMGLHRDPGKWKMSRSIAERRRWIWWGAITFDR